MTEGYKGYRGLENFDEILNQEGLQSSYEIDKNWRQDTKIKYLDLLNDQNNASKDYKIPAITHVSYFTNLMAPKEINDNYIGKYTQTESLLNSVDPNFKHFFWTNKRDLVEKSIPNNLNYTNKYIEEFEAHPLYPTLLGLINKGSEAVDTKIKYIVSASDILRIMAVQKYGGMYHDLDYLIKDPEIIVKSMQNFDFIGAREFEHQRSTVGNAFFAAKPSHVIMNEAAKMIYRNFNPELHDNVPEYVLHPYNLAVDVFFKTGPIMLGVAAFKYANTMGNTDMIFPSKVIYNIQFSRGENYANSADFDGVEVTTAGGDEFWGRWAWDHGVTSDIIYSDNSRFVKYVQSNSIDIVELLIKSSSININAKDQDGVPAIVIAARNNLTEMTKILVKAGADLEAKTKDGWTALMTAASYGSNEVLEILINAKAKIDQTNNQGSEAIHVAADNGHEEALKTLLKSGAKVDAINAQMHTPLSIAVKEGQLKIANILIDAGADLEQKGDDGYTPLLEATRRNDLSMVKLLVDNGADINAKNPKNYDSLMIAANRGYTDISKLLVSKGADIYYEDPDTGWNAFFISCYRGFAEIKATISEVDDCPQFAETEFVDPSGQANSSTYFNNA